MIAELVHADRRTDRQDEGNSRFSHFCERAKKSLTPRGIHLRNMKQAIMNMHTSINSLCYASIRLSNTARYRVHTTSTGRALSRMELVLRCCISDNKHGSVRFHGRTEF